MGDELSICEYGRRAVRGQGRDGCGRVEARRGVLPELWVAAAFLFVGLGIESTTFGLKCVGRRIRPFPGVTFCEE